MSSNKNLNLLAYPWSSNLGDSVQSYILNRYIAENYPVNSIGNIGRDFQMPDEYSGPRNEDRIILCGWLTQNPFRLIELSKLNLGYVGIHLTHGFGLTHKNIGTRDLFLSPTFRHHFSSGVIVGTRDTSTSDFLSNYGIENEFVGCVSSLAGLTHIKRKNTKNSVQGIRDFLLADLDRDTEANIKKLFSDNIRFTFWTNKVQPIMGESARINEIEKLFLVLNRTDFVITSRLHVALPSVSLGIPTLLITRLDSRFGGLADFLNILDPTHERLPVTSSDIIERIERKPKFRISEMQTNIKNKLDQIMDSENPEVPDSGFTETVLMEILQEFGASVSQKKELESEYQRLLNSRSWKASRPLRVLRQATRSKFHS